jgi:hypothetical protein
MNGLLGDMFRREETHHRQYAWKTWQLFMPQVTSNCDNTSYTRLSEQIQNTCYRTGENETLVFQTQFFAPAFTFRMMNISIFDQNVALLQVIGRCR